MPPRILLVDCDRVASRALAELLEEDGCKVTIVSSLEEALVAIDQSPPDVICSKFHLRYATAIDLMRRLKESAQGIPVIVLSPIDSDSRVRQALAEGAAAFKPLPLDYSGFRSSIASLLCDASTTGSAGGEPVCPPTCRGCALAAVRD